MIASIEPTLAAAAGGGLDISIWDIALRAWHGASAMSEAAVVHRRSRSGSSGRGRGLITMRIVISLSFGLEYGDGIEVHGTECREITGG